jgi:hypothetical protein
MRERALVSLRCISDYFPSLRKLVLDDNEGYTGSLRGLGNLEELHVWQIKQPFPLGNEATILKKIAGVFNILPMDSTSSLTKLDITADYGLLVDKDPLKELTRFTNLISLVLQPLDFAPDAFFSTNFKHLQRLAVTLTSPSLVSPANVVRFLNSNCLPLLQDLTLLFEPFFEEFNMIYRLVIQAITSNFSSKLKVLKLCTGINTAWYTEFGKLRILEHLDWITVEEEYLESENPMDLPMTSWSKDLSTSEEELEEMDLRLEKKIVEMFEAEFERSPLQSVFVKIIADEWSFSTWDDLMVSPEWDL